MGTLFISYRRTRSEAIDVACQLLQAQGVSIALDRLDVQPLGEFPERIRDAIADSHAMLVWWSDDYADSDLCMEEFRLGWEYARRKSSRVGQRLWILNPESSVQHIHAGDLAGQNYLSPPTIETGAAWARLIAARIAELEPTGRFAEGLSRQTASALHGVPEPVDVVGRGSERLRIHSAAFPAQLSGAAESPLVHVSGMAGIGKSALTLDYAHTYIDDFPGGVWWFDMACTQDHFETPDQVLGVWLDAVRHTLQFDLTGLREQVMHSAAGVEVAAVEVRNRLFGLLNHAAGPALWILNDFPLVRRVDVRDRALKALRLPFRHGLTIVTSRDARPMPASTMLALSDLRIPSAAYLLAKHLHRTLQDDEVAEVESLAIEVGGHPLAIALLGEFASADAVPLTRIRKQLCERGTLQRLEEIHSQLREDLGDSARSIVAAFEISIGAFRHDVHAKTLLALVCACAPGKPIPVDLLASGFGGDSRTDEFRRSLNALQRASLLTRLQVEGRFVLLHPLVAQMLEQSMDLRDTGATAAMASAVLHSMAALDSSAGAFVDLLPCVPHAEKLLSGMQGADAVRLCTALSRVHGAAGRFSAAFDAAERALQLASASLPARSRETLNARLAWACAIAQQGDLRRAAELLDELLQDARMALGPQDDDTLSVSGQLADTLSQQHHFDRADALQRDLVATLTSLHGPEHRDVLSALSHLAEIQYQRGRYLEALELQRQLQPCVERVHGPLSADCLIVTSNLAITELSVGRVEDAIRHHSRALEIGRGVFGHAHPALRACMTSLADAFMAADEPEMALALYERVLAVAVASLGDRHPETILACSRALAARALCHGDPPMEELAAFLAVTESLLAAGHPLVQQAVEHLVEAMIACRMPLLPMRGVLEGVLAVRTRDLGESDIETLRAASNLSIVLGEEGRWPEAVELRRHVLDETLQAFGSYDPQTVQRMVELADALQHAGNAEESVRLLAAAEESVARYVRSKVGH